MSIDAYRDVVSAEALAELQADLAALEGALAGQGALTETFKKLEDTSHRLTEQLYAQADKTAQ